MLAQNIHPGTVRVAAERDEGSFYHFDPVRQVPGRFHPEGSVGAARGSRTEADLQTVDPGIVRVTVQGMGFRQVEEATSLKVLGEA